MATITAEQPSTSTFRMPRRFSLEVMTLTPNGRITFEVVFLSKPSRMKSLQPLVFNFHAKNFGRLTPVPVVAVCDMNLVVARVVSVRMVGRGRIYSDSTFGGTIYEPTA